MGFDGEDAFPTRLGSRANCLVGVFLLLADNQLHPTQVARCRECEQRGR